MVNRSPKLDSWIRAIVTIVAFVGTGSGVLWSASAQVTRLDGRVTSLEKEQTGLVAIFTLWKNEHSSSDDKGWGKNVQDHREIMSEVRANAILLQDVARRQAVVLDRLKIVSSAAP